LAAWVAVVTLVREVFCRGSEGGGDVDSDGSLPVDEMVEIGRVRLAEADTAVTAVVFQVPAAE
jgi:hypothetical protein